MVSRLGAVAIQGAVVASRREKLQNDARTRVLRLVSENPHLSTRQVANAVGISNGSAYYLLTALAFYIAMQFRAVWLKFVKVGLNPLLAQTQNHNFL